MSIALVSITSRDWPQAKVAGGATNTTVSGCMRIGVGEPSAVATVTYSCNTRKGAVLAEPDAEPLAEPGGEAAAQRAH